MCTTSAPLTCPSPVKSALFLKYGSLLAYSVISLLLPATYDAKNDTSPPSNNELFCHYNIYCDNKYYVILQFISKQTNYKTLNKQYRFQI